jgi:hypothetical protein
VSLEHHIIKLFKRFGWVVARQSTVNEDAKTISIACKSEGLRVGREIGILEVLRYNRETLSAAKFQESASKFDFERLDAKYPYNPLLEKPHGM